MKKRHIVKELTRGLTILKGTVGSSARYDRVRVLKRAFLPSPGFCFIQVRIRSVGDELCCPICLEPPVAPQVTKCGHVFCFACLLHHAATAEKKWSTCPICFEMVYVEDLRSATLLPTPTVSVGDVLEMTLMTVVANPGLDKTFNVCAEDR